MEPRDTSGPNRTTEPFELRLERALLEVVDSYAAADRVVGGRDSVSTRASDGKDQVAAEETDGNIPLYVAPPGATTRARISETHHLLSAVAMLVLIAGIATLIVLRPDGQQDEAVPLPVLAGLVQGHEWTPLNADEWSYRRLTRTRVGDVTGLHTGINEERYADWSEQLWVAADGSGFYESDEYGVGRKPIAAGEVTIGGQRMPGHPVISAKDPATALDNPTELRSEVELIADALAFEATPPDVRAGLLRRLNDLGFESDEGRYHLEVDGHRHELSVNQSTGLLNSWNYWSEGVKLESMVVETLERRRGAP